MKIHEHHQVSFGFSGYERQAGLYKDYIAVLLLSLLITLHSLSFHRYWQLINILLPKFSLCLHQENPTCENVKWFYYVGKFTPLCANQSEGYNTWLELRSKIKPTCSTDQSLVLPVFTMWPWVSYWSFCFSSPVKKNNNRMYLLGLQWRIVND